MILLNYVMVKRYLNARLLILYKRVRVWSREKPKRQTTTKKEKKIGNLSNISSNHLVHVYHTLPSCEFH